MASRFQRFGFVLMSGISLSASATVIAEQPPAAEASAAAAIIPSTEPTLPLAGQSAEQLLAAAKQALSFEGVSIPSEQQEALSVAIGRLLHHLATNSPATFLAMYEGVAIAPNPDLVRKLGADPASPSASLEQMVAFLHPLFEREATARGKAAAAVAALEGNRLVAEVSDGSELPIPFSPRWAALPSNEESTMAGKLTDWPALLRIEIGERKSFRSANFILRVQEKSADGKLTVVPVHFQFIYLTEHKRWIPATLQTSGAMQRAPFF
jgi:hypothetical protein